jgi:hypothetical protein
LTPVPLHLLEGHWPFVEHGLLEIIEKTGEKWTPTHVLQALHEQRAYLFTCDDGFAVLQEGRDPWTSEPHLFIWAFWFKPDKARQKRPELFAWLDERAAPFGGRWKFSSPLMGWFACEGKELEVERIFWRRKT